jgi:hypothetical protein
MYQEATKATQDDVFSDKERFERDLLAAVVE